MTRLASTAAGIARIRGANADLLDVERADLGVAFAAGLTPRELAHAPRRDTVPVRDLELLATVPRPSKIWAVGFAYADHRIIGAAAKAVDEATAMRHVAGFTIGNNVSARDVRKRPDPRARRGRERGEEL